jgi:ketosteroid isomerase-like protein
MGRFTRQEIQDAWDHYCSVVEATNPKGSEKRPWAELYSEDAVYWEHQRGRFEGREAIYNWIKNAMGNYPGCEFIEFPVQWYAIDEANDRLIVYYQNRMSDPGDGQVYQEPNVSIMTYAGNNEWSCQEDIYNPQRMLDLIKRWEAARETATQGAKQDA